MRPTAMPLPAPRRRPTIVALLAVVGAALVAGCGTAASTSAPATATASSPPPTPAASSPLTGSGSPASPATTSGVHPAPRSAAAMAWDPVSEMVVLFGGATSTGPASTLEAWDGETWRRLEPPGPRPPARSDAILVADPARGVLVLHGGRSGQRILTDTWEWDGTRWRQAATDGPPPRVHAVSAFDHGANHVVLYGGAGEGDVRLTDTWTWDGTAWREIEITGLPERAPAGMAWDSLDERVLILAVDLDAPLDDGTYAAELWRPTDGAWERVGAGGPAFSPVQSFVEGPSGPWLIDGGALQGEFAAWEWRGDAWAEIDGPEPSPRNGQAVAFDAVRHQLVLFGGFRGNLDFGDTWVLDDGAWREADPGGS